MSKLELEGYWHIFSGKLKHHWAKLTDDDVHNLQGRQEERLGRMQKRAGIRGEAIKKEVNEAVYSLCCAWTVK